MKMFDKVVEILKELSGMEEMKPTDGLQSDLGLDSLMMVTLLVELEEALGIELDEADMNPFDLNTVGDVVALAGKYCGEQYEENC
ncbi:MAG: acyl carrier protein [Lachnospiraceae bacterium]|nr:acyl carrier protein [Lachnospiraceae bacterium]